MKSELSKSVDTNWIAEIPEARDLAKKLEAIVPDIKKLPTGMTRFQIENFVLSEKDFPGPDGKFWQSVREIWGRFTSLRHLWFDYNRSQIKLQMLERDFKKKEFGDEEELERQLALINIEEAKFSLIVKAKDLSDCIRQIGVFLDCIETLRPLLKYSDMEAGQKDFWRKKGIIDDKGKLLPLPQDLMRG